VNARRGGATEPRRAGGRLVLLRWIWIAQWRAQPGRALIAGIAIAIGVALALAIHLVNRSALVEFDSAIRITEGRAQAQIRPRTTSSDQRL
jgi:putative ABC transport system permease protein